MEAIIKYSKLIEDDGGFDVLRKELDRLGDDLKKKGAELKGVLNIIDPADSKAIDKLQTEIDSLKDSYAELAETNKMLTKAEEEYQKSIKDEIKMQDKRQKAVAESTKALDDLYVEMEQHRVAMKAVNEMEKQGMVTIEEATKARGRLKLLMKQLTSEINSQEKAVIESTKTSKKENDLIQAKLALENKEIDTLEKVRERMKNLRIVIQQTNLTTEEGKKAIKEMNAEVDQLTDTLSENSDKFIKNKINIGNYKDSVLEALQGTDLFKTDIALLDNAMDKLFNMFKKSTVAVEENTVALNANSKAVTNLKKAFSTLGNVLKLTGIVLVLALLASLFSVFKSGRAGVIKTEQAMAVFNVTMKVLVNTFADFGRGLIDWLASFGSTFSNITLRIEKLGLKIEWLFTKLDPRKSKAELEALENQIKAIDKQMEENSKNGVKKGEEGWKAMSGALSSFSSRLKDAKESIKTSFDGIVNAFKIADKIRQSNLQLIKLRKELALIEVAADDNTMSMKSMADATVQAGIKGKQVFDKEIDILKMQLQMANVKAKTDLQAAGMRVSSMNVENGLLATQIAFAKQLLALNQSMDPSKNPLSDELLTEQQDALKELMEKQAEYSVFKVQLAKKEREIKRDLFEQDLDLLIDLIDKDKTLSEQFVNNTKKNFESRVAEMQRFFKKFMETTQQEMDLFTRTASDQGLDLKFKINWQDDGSFKVMMGDTELALDNIVELNKQLQNSGLSEIAINRFREFIMETKAAQKDFSDLNVTLGEISLKLSEMRGETKIGEQELDSLIAINQEYEKLKHNKNMSDKEKKAILKKITELEKEKTLIENEAEKQRMINRIDSIDRELLQVEAGSDQEIALAKERNEIEIQLQQKRFDRNKEELDKLLEQKTKWQKFADELKDIFGQILDKYVEVSQKQLAVAEKNVDKQKQMQDIQRQRAQAGMENTLAFEEKELAKREAQKIKAEKKLQRAEKVKALWSSYTKNADNKEEKNPIGKTLKDFAILQAFEATFGDGGLAEDKVRTDGRGITRGRSHKGRGGGIPVLIEGNEGFFSGREVNNLGRENFHTIKRMAGRGPIERNMFSNQRTSFTNVVESSGFNDNRIVDQLKELKDTISDKPNQQVNLPEVVDGILTFVETIFTGDMKIRNHYQVKRKRL